MATLEDIGVSASINILSAFAFLLAFALLRIQPINDRVYFPKWYICGGRASPRRSANFVGKLVNLNFWTYLTFLNWMPQALRMSEAEIIQHAGLDSAVFLRIYTLGYPFSSLPKFCCSGQIELWGIRVFLIFFLLSAFLLLGHVCSLWNFVLLLDLHPGSSFSLSFLFLSVSPTGCCFLLWSFVFSWEFCIVGNLFIYLSYFSQYPAYGWHLFSLQVCDFLRAGEFIFPLPLILSVFLLLGVLCVPRKVVFFLRIFSLGISVFGYLSYFSVF